MVDQGRQHGRPLRVLHVLRAPLGGLFRHVVDLTREQIARGHAVGLVTDSLTGGATADRILSELEPRLVLGVTRVPIRRNPHPSDLPALLHVMRRMREAQPDIVHGHGSKGGALARLPGLLPGTRSARTAYTPHGGSLNHRPGTAIHRVYMAAERVLRSQTDLMLFESGFIASQYNRFVGRPPRLNRVIHNGIGAEEFVPLITAAGATDLLYVGELRFAKGIDTLLAAIARVARIYGGPPSLTLVGSGPDRERLDQQAAALGLSSSIIFRDPMPAREAFTLGRVLVIPSRAESLPYIVLEAAGACMPMVATNVGGIPEIFGPFRRNLVACDSPVDLSDAITDMLGLSDSERRIAATRLATHVRERFSIEVMADAVFAAYQDALASNGSRDLVSPVPTVALSS